MTPYRAGGVGGLAGREDERLAREWHVLPESVLFQSITLNGESYSTRPGRGALRPARIGLRPPHRPAAAALRATSYTIEVLALTGLIDFHEGNFEREQPDDGDFR